MTKKRDEMVGPKLVWAAVLCLAAFPLAAQPSSGVQQSPRQAIREMFAGDDEAFKKHLTLDVQAKISEQQQGPGGGNLMQSIRSWKAASAQSLESFETGTVLFSFNNAQEHERLEVHIGGEDLRGDEDAMDLSFHAFRSGVERELPMIVRMQLIWQRQQGIWRVSAVTVSASIPLGDPRILEKSWWSPPAAAALFGGATPAAVTSSAETSGRPKMAPARSLRLIGLAENLYAQKHPANGFTCSLAELVDIGKGFDSDNGGAYKFIDPEFAGGAYNGYRFALSGCTGKIPRAFQVVAEPLNGKGRAYCSDQTHDLRASDDGSGASCLASGKFVRQ
jgi:hypothetical protein